MLARIATWSYHNNSKTNKRGVRFRLDVLRMREVYSSLPFREPQSTNVTNRWTKFPSKLHNTRARLCIYGCAIAACPKFFREHEKRQVATTADDEKPTNEMNQAEIK